MNKLKNISDKDRRIYQTIILVFALICMIIGILCFQYYRHLQNTVKTEGSEYMQEISKQMETNVSKTINDNFSILKTMSAVIRTSNITSHDQLRTIVQDHRKNWNYQKIMLIDENGIAHDENNNAIVLGNDEYLQDAVVGGKESMSVSQVIDGKESIIFAIPFQNIEILGTKIAALAVSYDLSTFDQILSMTAFDGKAYAHIIRRDGTVVVRSSSPNVLKTGYNILNSLSSAQIIDKKTIEDIKKEIADGKSGQSEFKKNEAHEYMMYTPLVGQNWTLLTFVPAEVVNAKSEMLLKITMLLCAFITITFSLLLVALTLVFYRNKCKLENIAYVDPVTGGNTIQRFYELAGELLENSQKQDYALIYVNIEKFKVLNEQFGRDACNEILCSIINGISSDLEANECIGRLFADNFCILVKYKNKTEIVKRFEHWGELFSLYMKKKNLVCLPFVIEYGILVIENESMAIVHMIDRAKLSLTESNCELHGKVRYAIYDENVHHILFREKQLEDMTEKAFKNGEYHVYLQPKYHTKSEKISGAEALVRWINPEEGMIYPDEFIPLFEKNGFIVQLDFYVFEEVCRTIRSWIDKGWDQIKISVNCSRIHLKNSMFLDKYIEIAEKYKVPRHFLEIELTENTVFENVEYLSKIIAKIHEAGFGCSMDDFGSGYSSLNLIQDIPVDTIKLDKVFFKTNPKDMDRTESVVGSIISMTKKLSMETVAEGIEERSQVEMLKRLNCDYIQGYYFAKPMPIEDFEKLAFAEEDHSKGESKEDQ
ncbi:MAG: EAL domain-containing protein [Eubacterium sp.]